MGRIRRLIIYSDKIKTSKKILTYSDLHLGFKDRSNIKEVFTIPELAPQFFDYILIAGDIVHAGKTLENPSMQRSVISILSRLTGDTKTYVSIGNHDQYERYGFESWAAYGRETAVSTFNKVPNIEVLDIDKKVVENELEFSAFNSSVHYYLQHFEEAEIYEKEYNETKSKMSFNQDYFSILLTHDPKSIYKLSEEKGSSFVPNTNLVVSGHMHDGLTPEFLKKPSFGRGIISPNYSLFPEYAYGVKNIEDTIFLINGAVSTFVEIPFISKLYGVNCTIIELHPQEEKKLQYIYK